MQNRGNYSAFFSKLKFSSIALATVVNFNKIKRLKNKPKCISYLLTITKCRSSVNIHIASRDEQ